MSKNLTLALLCLIYCSLTRADIIFVDVNDSKSELQEASKIAKKLGVKLWIIPSKPDSTDLSKELAQTLETMSREKRSLDSMVVSGHYNGKKFYGEGKSSGRSITPSQIQQIFSRPEFKEKRMELNNLLLWGCYSARPVAMDFWTRLFPELQVLTGFNFAAPSSRTEAGPNLMYDVLLRFSEAMTQEALKTQIEAVVNSYAFKITHGVVYTRECYESSTLGSMELKSSSECPDILIKGLKKRAAEMYYPYVEPVQKVLAAEERKKICSHRGSHLGRFCIDAARYTKCFDDSNELPKAFEVHQLCHKYGCSW